MDRELAQLTVQTVNHTDGTIVVQLAGEIDISSAPILIDAFRDISAERVPNVILDATRISFMDSTGLHALVDGKRMIHEGGTNLILVPSSQMRRVMDLVFPEPLFAARVDSVEEALALIGSFAETPDIQRHLTDISTPADRQE